MACTVVKRTDGDAVSGFPSLFFTMQKTTINKKTKNNDVTKTKTGNDKKNKYAIVTRPDGDDVSNFPSLSFPMQKTTIKKKDKEDNEKHN